MASLTTSSLLPPEDAEDLEPMAGLGNLMDVMLVFACGLILALIAHYNVNLSQDEVSVNMQELSGELEYTQEGATESVSDYLELGIVYQNVETGQLYVVQPDEEGASAEDSSSVSVEDADAASEGSAGE